LNTGEIVNEIGYDYPSGSVNACRNYLAVIAKELYVYDISDPANPRLLWNRSRLGVGGNEHTPAFSPGCKYIAVADNGNNMLKIFDINGNLVYFKRMEGIWNVAWWKDRLAVGYSNGKIEMYRVVRYTPQPVSTTTTPNTSEISAVALAAAFLVPKLRKKKE